MNGMTGVLFANEQILASPTTGGTVSCSDSGNCQFVYITPAGTLAALTLNLPSNVSSRIGQKVYLTITQIITVLTVASAGASILDTPTAFTANQTIGFVKQANGIWGRIG